MKSTTLLSHHQCDSGEPKHSKVQPQIRTVDSRAMESEPEKIKRIPEFQKERRSAVEAEILRYLGALAKQDPEGFVYPSGATVVKKIDRTAFYVGQRIKYLQKVGRLIPVQRERYGRTVNGWIVVRYKTWADSQAVCADSCEKDWCAPQASENDFIDHPKNLADDANSFGKKEHSEPANPLKIRADSAIGGAPRSGLALSSVHDSDRRSLSQSTELATATALTPSFQSSKKERSKEKKTLRDRLVEKISREGEHLSFYRDSEGAEAYEAFLENIRAASKFLAFPFDENDPAMSFDFCAVLREKFEHFEHRLRTGDTEPAAFCSKVIDVCLKEHVIWPTSFGEHRNRLRRAEKAEQIEFWVKTDSDGLERRIGVVEESLDWN